MPRAITLKKRPTLKSKTHQGSPVGGHEERLASYIKRTLQLHGEGIPYHKIAIVIQQEFNLERVPAMQTVAAWKSRGFDALNADIQELQVQLRLDQLEQNHDQRSILLTRLASDKWRVMRTKMQDGEIIEYLDENIHKERMDMLDKLIKLHAREAKLMGLDLQAPEQKENGEMTFAQIQMWIIQQHSNPPQSGQVQVLELEDAGIPEEE